MPADDTHDPTVAGRRRQGGPVDQLRQLVERIERLEEEKAEVAAQIKEVYAEAKGAGYCARTLRKVVSLRKKKPEDLWADAAMLDLYCIALDMQLDLPLGSA